MYMMSVKNKDIGLAFASFFNDFGVQSFLRKTRLCCNLNTHTVYVYGKGRMKNLMVVSCLGLEEEARTIHHLAICYDDQTSLYYLCQMRKEENGYMTVDVTTTMFDVIIRIISICHELDTKTNETRTETFACWISKDPFVSIELECAPLRSVK
jgi:hypothetical protein